MQYLFLKPVGVIAVINGIIVTGFKNSDNLIVPLYDSNRFTLIC